MFKRVLIANRGEIACRIIRTLRAMGIESVAVYSDADESALHVRMADDAVRLGPAPVAESYLCIDKVVAAAVQSGAEAVHPGYGFLSEDPQFAAACDASGIVFLGPTASQLRSFGRKHEARALAATNNVPLLPGSDLVTDLPHAQREARRIGYPLLIKSTAGGGGIGMTICRGQKELADALASAQRLATNHFGDAGVLLERYVESPRHVEVQIFGDGDGAVIALGTRDCSIQRRNQKVVEEAPAPKLSSRTRSGLIEHARALASAAKYRSAGTVEFLVDPDSDAFFFLEMNTRLQVEHGVTEAVFGVDLVEWMVRLGAGDLPPLETLELTEKGHAIECRVYAEDPRRDYQPCTGVLTNVQWPSSVRCDTGVEPGDEISPFYDPLVAKLIVHADDRPGAVSRLAKALSETRLAGITSNVDLLRAISEGERFRDATVTTAFLSDFTYASHTVEVIAGGTQTTVQDWPGRIGYWAVGVPPSGPMDDYNFRLANRLLNNPEDTAALECTVSGPTLLFHTDTMVCLTGARMTAFLQSKAATKETAPEAVPYYEAVHVQAGDVLSLDRIESAGQRTYLAVEGGFDVPKYLGSRSTFTLGQFGGHAGRALCVGDVLQLGTSQGSDRPRACLPAAAQPVLTSHWTIGLIYGPHAAPDFFTESDMDMFFGTDWEVHYNSARTGVRLMGPTPTWARADGGEAGLHPSNIHDNAYAIGTIDFTGDMPVILGPDGPSLGGFVCPATIPRSERWKMGQLRPGDRVRFVMQTHEDALRASEIRENTIASLVFDDKNPTQRAAQPGPRPARAVLDVTHADDPDRPTVTYRPSGDDYLLVEYGPPVLDLALRLRAHELMTWLLRQEVPGVLDLTPGIRSLQVHYDPGVLTQAQLLQRLADAEREVRCASDIEIPTRIVHLPLSWDDPATRLAIEKYSQSVRSDAPWCPSNIEFIRRINGLADEEEVKKIVFDASYLVMGLGDVYLGAPVATPIDPRHRLVTTKYNPARTWTPENAVGIGGAYLCIYGMEGPGGYQFVGRTVPVWNRYRTTPYFKPGKPWLLEFFDQLRFYPVSAQELLALRRDFIHGRFSPRVETSTFSLGEHVRFLERNRGSIEAFQRKQRTAFAQERTRWKRAGQAMDLTETAETEQSVAHAAGPAVPKGSRPVDAHVSGCVWKLCVERGQPVQRGEPLVVLESMKTEFVLKAEREGMISAVWCAEGATVRAGQPLLAVQSA